MLTVLNAKSMETEAIAEGIQQLHVDLSHTVGQEADMDKIQWYRNKFLMFEEDGTLLAINAYLIKAQNDKTMNDYTRVLILKEATEIMSRDRRSNE